MTEEIRVNGNPFETILVIGNDKLSCSLSICLSVDAAQVTWFTSNASQGYEQLQKHIENVRDHNWSSINQVRITPEWPAIQAIDLVCISNQISLAAVKEYIARIEEVDHKERIIAIGTAGLPLSEYQQESQRPENIVGVNWTEPAHTTYFMEIIANDQTNKSIVQRLIDAGRKSWKKDPYLVKGEYGIQERLMSALLREALFLVANDYALPSDIDTSCRNDGGTYLPFAGNFRYMDLMGTYLYGVVMGKLNKELSSDNSVVDIFHKMIAERKTGIDAGEGFYSYSHEEKQEIERKMNAFAFDIRELMNKYNEINNS